MFVEVSYVFYLCHHQATTGQSNNFLKQEAMIKKILTNDQRLYYDGARPGTDVQVNDGAACKRGGNPRQAASQPYSIMPRKRAQILSR
mgnify:CR=1 FL=1